MGVKIKGIRREGPCGNYCGPSGFYPFFCIIENKFPILGMLLADEPI
jgi:hypothetical protein